MKFSDKQIAIKAQPIRADAVVECGKTDRTDLRRLKSGIVGKLLSNSEFGNVFATFATTLSVFGIYLFQGIIIARILGPAGRGEFGTAMFFPRDVFLYAGLFGGIEIVNSYAVKGFLDIRTLKYSAAKVGLISGTITGIIAAIISIVVLVCVGKTYLIPFGLLCCLFVPWEHMQLTISAVDRGTRNFRFYNVNRLLYAMTFLVLLSIVFGLNLDSLVPLSSLWVVSILFVMARVVGIIPTLRGMDLKSTLFGSVGNLEPVSTAEETLAVPSPWTLLGKGRFYAISMLASELFEKLDMFLIVAIASVTESGYYFVAIPAAQLLTVAPNALSVFTFNAGAEKERHVSLRQVLTVMAGTALLQLFSAIVFAFLIPHLIILFYKAPYAPAIPFALWLLPASAMKGYLQAVDGYLKGRDKPMIGVWARFLSIFVMLAFVGAVYFDWVEAPAQKLLSIPMAACLGQAISLVIISAAVIRDAIEQEANYVVD